MTLRSIQQTCQQPSSEAAAAHERIGQRAKSLKRFVLGGCFILAVSACASSSGVDRSLYEALGEKAGIQAITDEFLYSLAENPLALPLFQHTDIGRFREQFATQLCDVAGGPCEYTGDTMAQTHRGMHINRAQFNSVVDDLIAAMERRKVPTGAQNALLQRLAAFYPEIVER